MKYVRGLVMRVLYLPVYVVLAFMLVSFSVVLMVAWMVTGNDYIPLMVRALKEFDILTDAFIGK